MRATFLSALLMLSTVLSSSAQQISSASPQALQLLHSALTALTGSTPATDVTLSGTAHYSGRPRYF